MKDLADFSDNTELAAQKRQLLELLLAEEGIELDQTPQILPRKSSDELPLSFAQQRLWFFDQLQPGTSAYNIPAAVRLEGRLNVGVLEKSLNEIVRRHEALRTTFQKVNEQPVQVITPNPTINLSAINLSHLPKTEQEAQILRLAKEEAEYPFNLAHGSLLHVKLLHLAETEYVLLFVMHHIISDGWSLGVFVQELTILYEAFSTRRPSPLPELPIQYADFAIWQKQYLQGEVLEEQLSYWKQQLKGSTPLLQLPINHPRPAFQNFRGARHSITLSQAVTEALKAISQREGVTLFMTLLAAFKTLLYRYTNQDDISVGSPVANRNQVEIEHLIGMFVNPLVLRTDLSGNPSFRELLSRVREVALGAFSHQDVPFEKLVEELQPERNLSYTPLFQVAFALQNAPMSDLELAGIKLNILEIDNQTAKFDLSLDLSEAENGISGWFEYNTDLFDATTIARLSGHFQTLLEGIIANPEQRLSELPILTERERHQLLVEFNQTQSFISNPKFNPEECIHYLFEKQVERSPNAVAVVFEGEQLTYHELNSRANQLAHHLKTLGVKPEVLVGLCMARSLEMVVGILGILKAGGAYVPLDPAYPQERSAFMLENAQVTVLLTQAKLVETLPEHTAQVICLDTDWEEIANNNISNPVHETTPENLSYVLYTSGSTGKPKGVGCCHIGVVNLLADFERRQSLSVGDNCSFWATFCFDVSVYEIFSSLLTGSTLYPVPDSIRPDASKFFEWCEVQQISSAYIPPFMLNALSDWLEQTSGKLSLQRLLVGVEPIPEKLLVALQARIPGLQIINGYGPTETTICSTLYSVGQECIHDRNTPIGKPSQNTQIYLLDAQLQPVPIGIPGELYIGGDGLARGYVNRPDLTAEKFIRNPFSSKPGKCLYRTGDIARYLPNGDIEYIGRSDRQVKIRGLRIELGEIEAVLVQHPEVHEAVVTVWEDVPGDKRLVAYLVAQQQPVPSINELRSFLRERLPTYMQPSAFMVLEALPLLPNGKLDRRSLPAPERLRPELAATYVAPRTELERSIATIWQEALQLEKVGLHDNFFDLGGHSLLIVQVHSNLREILHRDVSILEMFQYPTISALAKYLSQEKNEISSFSAKNNNQLAEIKQGRNRLKQRLARSA